MDPNRFQSSTELSLLCRPWIGPGSPLPRSFKPHGYEIRPLGSRYGLLMAHRGPNPPFRENELSGPSRASQEGTFTYYPISLERSRRVQDAGQRNAKVRGCGVQGSVAVQKNTFFRLCEGGRKRVGVGCAGVCIPYLIY